MGLIVLDEEHDAAYKQEDSPRYHGRDVAVMRARLEAVTVVLGSATPSLESHSNALKGKYQLLRLPRRISARGLPKVEIVDRRVVLKEGGDRSEPAAARRAGPARAQGAGASALEPPGLGHEPRLPGMRAAGSLSQLLGSA